MGVVFSQLWPPAAPLTGANLPSQKDKVFLVTGGASGVGYELCKMLYHAGGKVYIGGRSEENANAAIQKITSIPAPSQSSSTTPGSLHFLPLSLSDLSTIKPAADLFRSCESRLDILFNNAGISCPPKGSQSTQNHELHLATNCLGPYLLTQLLLPLLISTAKSQPSAAVRVTWTSSIAVNLGTPNSGIDMAKIESHLPSPEDNYSRSKVGNWFLASELAGQVSDHGILSLTVEPGNLKTNLLRHFSRVTRALVAGLLWDPKYGAYTNLYAGFSGELRMADGGAYVLPWGRRHPSPRKDLVEALASKEDGGSGVAREFVEWCGEQVKEFT